LLSSILETNESFVAVYTLWEPDAFDGMDSLWINAEGHDATGRFIPYWTHSADGSNVVEPLVNYEVQGDGDYYLIPKNTLESAIVGPYMYPIMGVETSIISLVSPIIADGNFVGMAGIDLKAQFIQDTADGVEIYDGEAILAVIDGNGDYIAVTDSPNLAGESASLHHDEDLSNLTELELSYDHGYLDCHVPIHIDGVNFDWSVLVRIPESKIHEEGIAVMWRLIFVGTLLIVALLFVLSVATARLSQPLVSLNEKAKAISRGDLKETSIKTSNDEIGVLDKSISDVVVTSTKLTEVVGAVASGDFSVVATVRSEEDKLSISVNSMIDSLREGKLDSARKISYLNNVPTPVFTIDTNFNLLFVNKAAAEIVNLEVDECIGRKCHSLFSNGDCNSQYCATAKAMRDGTSFTRETLISLPGSKTLPARYTGAPLYSDETGELTGGIEFVIDISDEVKITEMAQKVSQGDYTVELTERSEDDILTRSLNTMTKTLLQTTNENEKQNWLRAGQMKINDIIRGDLTISTIATNVITLVAEVIDASVGAIYLRDEQERFILTGSYAFRKRKSISNSIKAGEGLVGQCVLEKKPILLTSVPSDYIVINSGLGETAPDNIIVQPVIHDGVVSAVIELGKIGSFTDIQLKLLEVVSENVGIAIYGAQSRDSVQLLLEQTQQQSEELQTQQEELKQTNEELEEQTQALKEASERLQTQQEELRQTNEELEERSEELEKQSSSLADKNRELEDSRELIEKKAQQLAVSSKYKSEFLANMSHELRTPLNSMLILSGILETNKESNLTSKQIEFAKTIHSSGSSLLNLINEILDLSKIESGKMELVIEDVSLSRFLADTRRQFLHLAEQNGVEYQLTMEDSVPEIISTDEQRVGQILKNLLSNAFKFTAEGSISVLISKASVTDAEEINVSQAIAISVKDTGCGIPKEKIQVIFEAFQQADGTTSRKYGGTGLGLSIARELAVLLGGRLTLESKPGEGSVFTLYLPVDFPGKPRQNVSEPTEETVPLQHIEEVNEVKFSETYEKEEVQQIPDDRRDIKKGDKVMLVVEDDLEFAKILFSLAKEKGYMCIHASDGNTALQMASEFKPDGVLLDIGLPGMSGLTVLSRLKEDLDTRHIPVHMISGHDRRTESLKGGAIGFLRKPVSMDQMNQLYDRLNKMSNNPIKELLIVEDDVTALNSMVELLSDKAIRITTSQNGAEAFAYLKKSKFDCIILDYSLPDTTAEELLVKIRNDGSIPHTPTIIHTGRELSKETLAELDKYTERVIIKGDKSAERLLDEATLFMHTIESNLPEEKRKMIHLLHDKEAIFKDRTILVVDDDMRNVFALSSVLEEKGFNLLHAKNGLESLKKLEMNPDIDLVLMDIMMPVMDGYEAMTKIRKQSQFKDLPIIALTAKAMKGDRAKCIEAGASDYLAKPIDIAKLLSALRVWLYR